MWSCPFCGSHYGIPFEDQHLRGILCLHPDCGRVDVVDDNRSEKYSKDFSSDM
ncbi:hypothetical protein L1765_04025 [Microaerobacter geothermalis]|uniref:hypothetical protein n=1 Tax=Microaerobacter geothermalis TaxID=674972 RepID=UPI001F222C8F|nr:hypothetical protein [Microaerobacter geothermalis]MCF6093163.1 hypothetical protein [Microaerobacter geothermalis]